MFRRLQPGFGQVFSDETNLVLDVHEVGLSCGINGSTSPAYRRSCTGPFSLYVTNTFNIYLLLIVSVMRSDELTCRIANNIDKFTIGKYAVRFRISKVFGSQTPKRFGAGCRYLVTHFRTGIAHKHTGYAHW